MGQWINFAEVRAKISLEDVILKYYQIDTLKRDGAKLVGPCPIHKGDSPRAFHADLGKNVWHCFSQCKKGGNQLDFVVARDGVTVREAALRLQAFFLGGGSAPPPLPPAKPAPPAPAKPAAPAATPSATTPTPPPATATAAPAPTTPAPATPREDADEETTNPVLDVKLALKGDHPHLTLDRQLKPETVQHFGVGYCARGILRGMIAIPIHDEDGDLVAYAGRRLKPSDIREYGKYKLPKGFKKELVLYNYHRAKAAMAEHGLILVEGFFSTMKLHEAGFPNVVAAMGSEVSEAQGKLLAAAPEVIVLFDGNDAGAIGAEKARELLADKTIVRLARLPKDTQPEGLSPKALRWLVNGMKALDLSEVSLTLREEPKAPPTT